jgi:hypothetical protein
MPEETRHLVKSIPDFDVLSEDPEHCAELLKNKLEQIPNIEKIQIIKHAAIDEIIPKHLEIRIGKEMIAFIYEPIACHNYNIIPLNIGENNKTIEVRVATIDTMLSFYLAFLYANKNYYYKDRILCIAKFLFDVEQKNRLEQKGLLKRFSIECYGKSSTIENIRAEKAKKFQELKYKKNTEEYERWFLKYNPSISKKDYYPLQGKHKYTKKRRIRYYNHKKKGKRNFINTLFKHKNTRKKGKKKDVWLI